MNQEALINETSVVCAENDGEHSFWQLEILLDTPIYHDVHAKDAHFVLHV